MGQNLIEINQRDTSKV